MRDVMQLTLDRQGPQPEALLANPRMPIRQRSTWQSP